MQLKTIPLNVSVDLTSHMKGARFDTEMIVNRLATQVEQIKYLECVLHSELEKQALQDVYSKVECVQSMVFNAPELGRLLILLEVADRTKNFFSKDKEHGILELIQSSQSYLIQASDTLDSSARQIMKLMEQDNSISGWNPFRKTPLFNS